MHSPILTPVVLLAAWSMVMWAWMYVMRLPAIRRSKMRLDPNAARGEQMAMLPPRVRWKADNYNHLMEQPTVFYATAIALALLGHGDGWAMRLAWTYLALRVLHSFVQALWNRIEVRFSIFALSSFALIGMVGIALRVVL
ncbi:MAG TPA: MAPEG family protein [Kofleriaceae bacterium]